MCKVKSVICVIFPVFEVKEKLLQFEDLKEKYHLDYSIKEKEVSKMNIFSWVSFKTLKQPQVG